MNVHILYSYIQKRLTYFFFISPPQDLLHQVDSLVNVCLSHANLDHHYSVCLTEKEQINVFFCITPDMQE